MPRQKRFVWAKKFFSRNRPRGAGFLSEEKHKVYSLLVWREKCWEGLHPRLKQRAADRRRGRNFHKERLLQKIFVQNDEEIIIKNFTKPLDKPLPLCYNTDTNKGKRYTTMHAYTALIIFGLVAPIVFIAIPLLVENIMLKKEG